MLVVLTAELGRISVLAKGARRPGSRFAACSRFLCYGEFLLFPTKDIYSLNSCEIIENFYGVSSDLDKLTCVAHIVELVNDTVLENQPSVAVLRLFLNALHLLATSSKNPIFIARVFEFKLLCMLGYSPNIEECSVCGESRGEPQFYFSFELCSILCSSKLCLMNDNNAVPLSHGLLMAFRYMATAAMNRLFSFELDDEILQEFGRIMNRYLYERLEKDYKKLNNFCRYY